MARGGGSQSTTTAANTGGNRANNGNDGNGFASLKVSVSSESSSASVSSLSNNQCQQLIALLNTQLQGASHSSNDQKPIVSNFTSISSSIPQNAWILDIGAIHHVCHNIDYVASFDFAILTPYVALLNGQHVSISRVGTVRLSSHMLLEKVLYVLNFKYNLLSVSSLTKGAHYSLVFSADCCVIQDSSQALQIGMGKRIRNFYYLVLPDSRAHSIAVCNSVIPTSETLWHYRLGHPLCVKV
ncbi:hypothetical protein LWI29_002874 [Acer saccharum]|uniref:Retrovirus-related Pol polyprotein from transposon TNT 1-94-like beta-barrel domain-containing protein n=1 Tax=Acer saccharum TaxID=4024 RepID=A0AA39TAZ1_ACESA|nr:hypothetical protein LWI29_002874 [Acer saccharum]